MKWLKFAFKNVMRNRRRALAAILITTVGSSGILISGGFALYTYDSLRENATRDSGHIVLAHKGYFDQVEETPLQYGLADYQQLIKQLKSDPRVRTVLPRLGFTGLITNGDLSTVFVGSGIQPRGEFTIKGPFFTVKSGQVLSSRQADDADPQVMLGSGLAQQLNAQVGDSLTILSSTVNGSLNALDVTVQGIFTVGTPEIDKRSLMLALPQAQELLQTDKTGSLSVYLRNTEMTEAVARDLRQSHPELAQQAWWETAFYYHAVRDLYNRIFGLLGAIIIAMVFFAISNTLSMSVIERTREIGTLRAMGAYPGEIMRNFVLEALVMASIGIALGVVLAISAAVGVQLAGIQMPPPPSQSVGYPLIFYVDAKLYLGTALTLLLLSIAAAWLASRRAVQKPIVEALAHV